MKKATLTFVGDMMCSPRMTERSGMDYSFAFSRATKLKECDQVAYVRFASVYREFKDVDTFLKEIKELMKKKK